MHLTRSVEVVEVGPPILARVENQMKPVTHAIAGETEDCRLYRSYYTRQPANIDASVGTPCRNVGIRTDNELDGVRDAYVRGANSPRAGGGAVLPGHSP